MSGRRTMRATLTLLLILVGWPAGAQCPPAYDWSGFYPSAILDRVIERTAPGLRSNFEQVMLPRLSDQERRALGAATLDLEQREYPAHPLNFYAAQGGKVVLPLSSVRMASDLMLAVAWLNRQDQALQSEMWSAISHDLAAGHSRQTILRALCHLRKKIEASLLELAKELVDLDIQVLDWKADKLDKELGEIKDELSKTRDQIDKVTRARFEGLVSRVKKPRK